MAVTRDILFNINDAAKNAGKASIPTSTAWDAGVVFNRTNAIPIDKFSVFDSYENAVIYATTNPVAYPGQLIAVVPEDDRARSYIILAGGALKEIGVDIDLAPIDASIAEIYKLLDIDYDKTVAFDIEELVVDFANIRAILGDAILGQMILGRAK